MKQKVLLFLTIAFLSGCAGNIKLVEEGKIHHGRYDQISKKIEVSIDNVIYRGSYSQSVTSTAATGTIIKNSPFTVQTGTAFGSTTDGSGQAILISSDGKVIRCNFGSIVAWRGQGQCQSNSGKSYDLIIGN
jgi:hypothetical protein